MRYYSILEYMYFFSSRTNVTAWQTVGVSVFSLLIVLGRMRIDSQALVALATPV